MQCQNVHYIMYIMSTSMHYCRCILQKLCDIKWMFYQKHLWQTYEWLCCSVIVINIMFRNISDICFSVFFFFFSERCDEVLASPLPYSAFTSSSVLAADFGAGYAKLNRRVGEDELCKCVSNWILVYCIVHTVYYRTDKLF